MKTIIRIDPSNVEDGVEIKIPNDLRNMTIKYYNIGFTEFINNNYRQILNSWFYCKELFPYYSTDSYLKHFLFPLNDNCFIQNKYEIKIPKDIKAINLTIRDIYYGNELPQYYREDFTLIAVIEFN